MAKYDLYRPWSKKKPIHMPAHIQEFSITQETYVIGTDDPDDDAPLQTETPNPNQQSRDQEMLFLPESDEDDGYTPNVNEQDTQLTFHPNYQSSLHIKLPISYSFNPQLQPHEIDRRKDHQLLIT